MWRVFSPTLNTYTTRPVATTCAQMQRGFMVGGSGIGMYDLGPFSIFGVIDYGKH